jgi:hypothetical protein
VKRLFSLLAAAVISLRGEASTFRRFPEEGFSLVIPDGFSELTGSRVPAGARAAYAEGDIRDGRAHAVIALQILNGLIGKDEHLTADQLAHAHPGIEWSVGRMTWKKHAIDSFGAVMTQNGIQLFSIAAQVPLAPKALQITVVGPLDQKDAISADAARLVSSVTGETNWEGPVLAPVNTWKAVQGIVVSLIELAVVCAFVVLVYRRITGGRTE